MNAPRICELCNGVYKTPQFLHFSTTKCETKTIAHLSIPEGEVFEIKIGALTIILRNGKKDLIQVGSEFLPQTAKLVT